MNIKDEVLNKFIRNGKIVPIYIKKYKDFIDSTIIQETKSLNEITPTIPQRIWHIVNDVYIIQRCINGNLVRFDNFKTGYNKHCSNKKCECFKQTLLENKEKIAVKRELTNLERYGNIFPNKTLKIKEKTKNTNLERYGVENPQQNITIKEKTKNTNLERYGTKNIFNSTQFIKKREFTMLERYGTTHPIHNKDIKDKIKNTNLKVYGVTHHSQNEDVKNKKAITNLERYNVPCNLNLQHVKNKKRDTMLQKYGVENPSHIHLNNILQLIESQDYWNKFNTYQEIKDELLSKISLSTILIYIHRYRPDIKLKSNISYPHKIINEFLDSLGVEYVINTRKVISPVELDIFIPSKNLAIEINGVYWHTEEKGKDKNYHLNKTERCEEKGIDLIHLTDIDILTKQDIVFDLIKDKLKLNKEINVSDCVVIDLDKETCIQFIKENSLFEYKDSDIHKGLVYNNEIVSVIAINQINSKFDYVIKNYTTKVNYTIKNGLNKLLKDIKGTFIISIDRRYTNNKIYNSDLLLLNTTKPKCYFTNNYLQFYSNINDLSNSNNYHQFWDCGKILYSYNII